MAQLLCGTTQAEHTQAQALSNNPSAIEGL